MNEIWKAPKNRFAVSAENPMRVMGTTHNPSKMEDVATNVTKKGYCPRGSMPFYG